MTAWPLMLMAFQVGARGLAGWLVCVCVCEGWVVWEQRGEREAPDASALPYALAWPGWLVWLRWVG